MASGASAELLINWRTFLDRAVVLEVATWLASPRRARSRRSRRRFLTVDGVAGQFRAVRGPGDGGKETPPPSGRRHLGALNAKHGPALAKAARSVSRAYGALACRSVLATSPTRAAMSPESRSSQGGRRPRRPGTSSDDFTNGSVAPFSSLEVWRSDGLAPLLHWLDLGAFSKRRCLDRSLVRVRLRLQDTTRRRSQISTATSS